MSAFIVSRKHIDHLLAASGLESYEASKIGRMLWIENVKSVAFRYPKDTPASRPGPSSDNIDAEAESYVFTPPPRKPPPLEGLKLLGCYEYQSCEHDTWESSQAKAWCEQLRATLVTRLPGWTEAAWTVD